MTGPENLSRETTSSVYVASLHNRKIVGRESGTQSESMKGRNVHFQMFVSPKDRKLF